MGWDDIGSKSTFGERKEIKYMDTKTNGARTYRALDSAPFSRWTHWIPSANGGKGLGITCPGHFGKPCPICDMIKEDKANKAAPRYTSRKLHVMNFLNRANGEVEILDKGNTVFELLKGVVSVMGDLTTYDITLSFNNGAMTPIPMPKTPLTDAELAMDKFNFGEIYKELTEDQVLALIGGASFKDIFAEAGAENADSAEQQPAQQEKLEVDFTK